MRKQKNQDAGKSVANLLKHIESSIIKFRQKFINNKCKEGFFEKSHNILGYSYHLSHKVE